MDEDMRSKIIFGRHPLEGWVVFNPLDDIAYEIDFVVDGVALATEVGFASPHYAIPLNEMKATTEWFSLFPSLKAFQTYNEAHHSQKVVVR